MKPTRILLADDHALLLAGLVKLLAPDFEIVGSVTDGRALVEATERLKPDIVLLDIGMPLLNGLEAARQIHKSFPEAKLIFLTMHADAAYVTAGFAAGAKGYVLKTSAESELRQAILSVAKGQLYVSPLIGEDVRTAVLMPSAKGTSLEPELTARQREVLQLIAEGRPAKEIAALLKISVKTAEYHKYRIMEKLGARSTAELTRCALRLGIIPGEDVIPSP